MQTPKCCAAIIEILPQLRSRANALMKDAFFKDATALLAEYAAENKISPTLFPKSALDNVLM